MHPLIPIIFVFIGCCSNVVFLELLVTEQPGSGNIITFAQFLAISIEGFIRTTRFGTKKPAIPISTYIVMVGFFLVVSVVNNYALNFNISMPLHLIFRSGSLMANLTLGVIILKKRYTLSKYLSVLTISVGIAMATLASSADVGSKNGESEQTEEQTLYEYMRWLTGLAMLTFALFMSARMGIYQETVYQKFGKHPAEALFYNHALPLPMFLFLSSDIVSHIRIFNQSTPVALPLLGIAIPRLWAYLLGNVLTQYICIKSVFILTTECASLTVTLVVTLRKFVSLIFSIVYFSNPFTLFHWIGTLFVFGGTLVFTGFITQVRESLLRNKDKSQ